MKGALGGLAEMGQDAGDQRRQAIADEALHRLIGQRRKPMS